MGKGNFFQKVPVLLSLVIPLLAIPMTIVVFRTNQDIRSQAILREEKTFTNPFPYLKPSFASPTPSPTPTPTP